MKKIINKVLEISKKFPKPLTKEERFIQLVEEVGELANAIAITEGHKSEKCARADLNDSFADVFFDLILLANLYEVDLEKETEAMLKRLDKRIKDQEFEF